MTTGVIGLPSGTVTFLFTDVAGSTRLLHSLGAEAYADELAEHRRLIRDACAGNAGVEVDTQGDAFFFAFPSAPGALRAAEEMTDALAAGPIQVRIGLHTGTPHLTSEGYVGEDVHRAARIAAAGHGGQVLVSEETRSGLEEGAALVSLGAHRLKDFEGPVTIYQLGDGSFPPLKTIANTNLPTPASSFLGREEELFQAGTLLTGTRLLTIHGPGGQGKTRFALELARRAREERFSDYEDGVFSCFLAPLRDPALVLSTICQTLSLPEEAGRRALETLVSQLEGKRMLLLLDNLEHLLSVAPELSELLAACPELTLVVTSRELLRVSGERPFDLPPLPEEEGVALFCERARSEPSDTIRTLCARLEGLPLAIELAAARMRLLTPEQLLERLSQRLDLFKGGRDTDPRQQTLRATIEWSYDLLSPDEQELFARLSVFVGGCTLEAAEEVAGAELDTLESLLDKSLLRRLGSEAGPRFWMLETIREYAGERFQTSGEEDSRRERHLAWYANLAIELAEPVRKYSPRALAALEHDLDNMRAALAVAVDRDEVVRASDLMTGLWFYWLSSGRGEEALAWAERYLASSRQSVSALERLEGDLAAAEILRFTGDHATAAELKREGVATGRAHPNTLIHGVAIERSIAATLSDLAYIEVDAGRFDEARACAAEALALRRELGLPHGIAHALIAVAAVEFNARDFDRAGELYAEAAVVSEGAGAHGDALEARLEQAECELLLGRLDEAEALLRGGLPAARSLQDLSFEVLALRVAAMLAAAKGEAERSAILFGALDANLQEGGLTLFGPVEEELKRPYLDGVRRDLGEERFRAAYQRGMRERKSIEFD